MNIKVILEAGRKGGFKAYVPSIPGCYSSGISESEALENVKRAALLHFGIEEVVRPKYRGDKAHFKYMLTQMEGPKMSEEKKLATVTSLTGLFLMIAVIWTAAFFT